MLFDVLFWIYLANTTLLIVHEIDSAYWKEWELFKMPGGAGFFMLLHIPLAAVIIYGFYQVSQQSTAGLIFALLVALGGVLAFVIHFYFIKKGRPEFNTPVSLIILYAILIVSLAQIGITLYLMIA